MWYFVTVGQTAQDTMGSSQNTNSYQQRTYRRQAEFCWTPQPAPNFYSYSLPGEILLSPNALNTLPAFWQEAQPEES